MKSKMQDNFADSSNTRLQEAEWLCEKGKEAGRFEGCFYIGGYVVETSLKLLVETIQGSIERKFRIHNIPELGQLINELLNRNDLVADFVSQELFEALDNELIQIWEVEYRYQGHLDFLSQEKIEIFLGEIKKVHFLIRQYVNEWNLLRGAEDEN